MSDGATFEEMVGKAVKTRWFNRGALTDNSVRVRARNCLTAAGVPDLLAALRAKDAEIERLRGHVERWAADKCDDPLDHSAQHNVDGVPTGQCARCEASWPCPSAIVALSEPAVEASTEDE